jgi:effector-binding domain-containing protein
MKTYEIQLRTLHEQPTAVRTATLPVAEFGPWLGKTLGGVATVITAHGAYPAGPPFARYHQLAADRFAVEAGFPVSAAIGADGDVLPSQLPGGPVAVTVHTGPYEQMAPAYEALAAWVSSHGGEPAGDPWEVYFSDPAAEPDPATWRTEIVQPYRQV